MDRAPLPAETCQDPSQTTMTLLAADTSPDPSHGILFVHKYDLVLQYIGLLCSKYVDNKGETTHRVTETDEQPIGRKLVCHLLFKAANCAGRLELHGNRQRVRHTATPSDC